MNIFKTNDEGRSMRELLNDNIEKTEKFIKDTGACLRKLSRLEQLADDLNRHAEAINDVTIFSRENEVIGACRFIIAARAPTLHQN
ncbi:unnamed protein product [Gongylonema pulchrum]|uniref:Uncharacterized protein n=1 Tax=Gongylonema pulchrum TaxID=637853 RepID=A0A3P6SBS3_9BILA|nr:unnamed protein product [Gongylonema pulchrum]